MKIILSAFVLGLSLSAFGQCFTNVTMYAPPIGTNGPAVLDVSSNQICRITHMKIDNTAYLYVTVGDGALTSTSYTKADISNHNGNVVVIGPARIIPSVNAPGDYLFFTAELSTPCLEVSPSLGAVVIPTEPAGNVDIKLESSSDMVNWAAAIPGTYGTGTTNRFFRVRAARQN